jgi:hypothetical protein
MIVGGLELGEDLRGGEEESLERSLQPQGRVRREELIHAAKRRWDEFESQGKWPRGVRANLTGDVYSRREQRHAGHGQLFVEWW